MAATRRNIDYSVNFIANVALLHIALSDLGVSYICPVINPEA
ncbi:MAG: hypothetical protein QXF26_03425 [Candidatus Bathyarchaeia archaeon]